MNSYSSGNSRCVCYWGREGGGEGGGRGGGRAGGREGGREGESPTCALERICFPTRHSPTPLSYPLSLLHLPTSALLSTRPPSLGCHTSPKTLTNTPEVPDPKPLTLNLNLLWTTVQLHGVEGQRKVRTHQQSPPRFCASGPVPLPTQHPSHLPNDQCSPLRSWQETIGGEARGDTVASCGPQRPGGRALGEMSRKETYFGQLLESFGVMRQLWLNIKLLGEPFSSEVRRVVYCRVFTCARITPIELKKRDSDESSTGQFLKTCCFCILYVSLDV
jgi:hypothetical protein